MQPDTSRYVALPLDAEGEPIHVGDEIEWPDGQRAEVIGIGGRCVTTLYYLDEGEKVQWTSSHDKCHHKPRTVDDVVADCCATLAECDVESVERYVREAYELGRKGAAR